MKRNSGQMMIEVLFALAIMVIILLALTAGAVIAIKNARFAQNVVLANQYAQGALELARQERDQAESWDGFGSWAGFKVKYNITGVGDKRDWCLDESLNWSACSCSTPSDAGKVGIFFRCVNFYNDHASGERALVSVTVSWSEAGRDHQSRAATILSQWTN